MAKQGVIVRQLNAIENLGSMDTLCTDKTGTLTVGVVQLDGALDVNGQPSDEVMRYAYLNAAFQTGLANPLDEAILAQPHPDTTGMDKLEEIPYDFVRKRLSVVVDSDPGTDIKPLLITKGALDNILTICTRVQIDGSVAPLDRERHQANRCALRRVERAGLPRPGCCHAGCAAPGQLYRGLGRMRYDFRRLPAVF